ncbi:MAG: hypothetical protein E7494_14150 [Ruminococcus albus]|nr:hypothetical protein [Ruminococcus albus]
MVSDEEIILMRKTYIPILTALFLTGCGTSVNASVAEPVKTQTEVKSETTDISRGEYDTFFGVLMDECCSDIEDPALHETNCMFMEGCRESGYGLDIRQEDGSWVFYMFDEAGQQLTLDYLEQTERVDGLYVTVTGTMENEVIKVISIEES